MSDNLISEQRIKYEKLCARLAVQKASEHEAVSAIRQLCDDNERLAILSGKRAARLADLERQLAEARDTALEEAAVVGGDAAVEVLLRQEPDASPIKVQLTRQAIANAIRKLKGTP